MAQATAIKFTTPNLIPATVDWLYYQECNALKDLTEAREQYPDQAFNLTQAIKSLTNACRVYEEHLAAAKADKDPTNSWKHYIKARAGVVAAFASMQLWVGDVIKRHKELRVNTTKLCDVEQLIVQTYDVPKVDTHWPRATR